MRGFVRGKLIRGKARYYWCINSRDNSKGQPRQKVIAYLGHMQSVQTRRVYFQKQLRRWKRIRNNRERDLQALRTWEAGLAEARAHHGLRPTRRRWRSPRSLDEIALEENSVRLESQRITISLSTIREQIRENLKAIKRLVRDIKRGEDFLRLCSAYA